jgi:hypothetical protein
MSVSKASVQIQGSSSAIAAPTKPIDFDIEHFTGFTPSIISMRKVKEGETVWAE